MNDIGRTQLLAEMQRMAAEKGVERPVSGAPGAAFGEMLEKMVENTNAAQTKSADLSESFVSGSEKVELVEVMVAMQKARVHFETMVQVRNRLVRAYEEIMRMPM